VATTSLRKVAPSAPASREATEAPVFTSKPRTASMSATQRTPSAMAIPLGAWRTTPRLPPWMKGVESARVPSALRRSMKPLPSLADGLPLMFETYQKPVALSQRTDSGVWNPSVEATLVGVAGAGGGAGESRGRG